MATQRRVFISYKSEYRDFAEHVRDNLRSWGYNTWFDGDNIRDELWRDEIQAGLESSDFVIGIVTPEALESREVLSEWDFAYSKHDEGKHLFLLEYRDVEEVPYWLRIVQRFDCRSNPASGLEQLKEALTAPSSSPADYRPPPDYLKRHQVQDETPTYQPPVVREKTPNKRLYITIGIILWIII